MSCVRPNWYKCIVTPASSTFAQPATQHACIVWSVEENIVFITMDDCTIEHIKLTEKRSPKTQRAITESGNKPRDNTLDKDGHLVYTDEEKQTINLLKNDKIQVLLTTDNWKPLTVCLYLLW